LPFYFNPPTPPTSPTLPYTTLFRSTGAIMAVPGHDTRDLEFARKFDLPIIPVVEPPVGGESIGFTGDGMAINSGFLNGLPTAQADRKSTRLNSSHLGISYAVFCLKK